MFIKRNKDLVLRHIKLMD